MSTPTLEERVSRLEQLVERLLPKACREPGRDDWKRSLGAITDDELTREVIEGAFKIREADRAQVEP